MTYDPVAMVAEFHDKFNGEGKERHERPVSINLLNKRRRLINEESTELLNQFDHLSHTIYQDGSCHTLADAWADLAKEMADTLYTIYGTAEELGIDIYSAFAIVHESNMNKLWPDGQVHYNEYGKIIKPPSYVPPDLGHVFYDRN